MGETRTALRQLHGQVQAAAEEKAQAEQALQGRQREHQAASERIDHASKLVDAFASFQDFNGKLTEVDATLDMSAMVMDKVCTGLVADA